MVLPGYDGPVECQWFVLCFEEATCLTDHPILGKVPTCEEHDRFAKGE